MERKRLTPSGIRTESDSTYFRRQASEERTSALHALHPKALEKADRYESLVRAIAERELHVTVRLWETA